MLLRPYVIAIPICLITLIDLLLFLQCVMLPFNALLPRNKLIRNPGISSDNIRGVLYKHCPIRSVHTVQSSVL